MSASRKIQTPSRKPGRRALPPGRLPLGAELLHERGGDRILGQRKGEGVGGGVLKTREARG
jgi:hypothetical protein